MKVPCQNCEERKAHCHASCEKYKEFFEHNRKHDGKREAERMIDNFANDSLTRNVRIKHRKRGK